MCSRGPVIGRALSKLLLVAGAGVSLLNAGWNPRLAADYLDARQKEWFAWKGAQGTSGPCMSCHTGVTYLLARPALRRKLNETQPTQYETALVDGMRARVEHTEGKAIFAAFSKEPLASQAVGVETVFAALFLAGTPDEKRAFNRLWSLKQENNWNWFSLNLDPWEMPESGFFGATMALMAAGNVSAAYRATPEFQAKERDLAKWLAGERARQPLHNQLMLLAASGKVPDAITPVVRRALVQQTFAAQQPDGSWTMASLGPWNEHAAAPKHEGSDAYATALAAYALKHGGTPATDARLKRALAWLEANQTAYGYWEATSMNKMYPPDSMMSGFMRDAATGFAAMALIDQPSAP